MENENFTTAWKHGTSGAGKNYAKLIDDSRMLHVIPKSSMFLSHLPKRIVLLMITVCCMWIYEQQRIYFWVSEYLIFLHPWLYFFSVRGPRHIKVYYQKTPAESEPHVGCSESWFKFLNFILSRFTSLLHVLPQVWYCIAQIQIWRVLLFFC